MELFDAWTKAAQCGHAHSSLQTLPVQASHCARCFANIAEKTVPTSKSSHTCTSRVEYGLYAVTKLLIIIVQYLSASLSATPWENMLYYGACIIILCSQFLKGDAAEVFSKVLFLDAHAILISIFRNSQEYKNNHFSNLDTTPPSCYHYKWKWLYFLTPCCVAQILSYWQQFLAK